MHTHLSTGGSTQMALPANLFPVVTSVQLGPWAQHALCAHADPEIFFPTRDDSGTQAGQICRRCPVGAQCLAFAISNDEPSGIWGGLDPGQRRNLRRSLQRRKWAAADGNGAA